MDGLCAHFTVVQYCGGGNPLKTVVHDASPGVSINDLVHFLSAFGLEPNRDVISLASIRSTKT